MPANDPIYTSVIIPLKNEATNIGPLLNELIPVMNALHAPWEVICVDDGSTDQTLAVLKEMRQQVPQLHICAFTRHYGQSSALDAGFQAAKGTVIVTLDGDGQNDPGDIPKLLNALHDCDLVCGYRVGRHDAWTKRYVSRIANAIRGWVCGDGVQDTGCSLKAYRKASLLKLKLYEGMHRFLPALFCIEGFRVKEIPVSHRKRLRGKSKYSLANRHFNTVLDLFAVAWMRRRKLNYTLKNESHES